MSAERLGKNINGYFGESVDIRAILRDIKAAAQRHGWASETFFKAGDVEWVALTRPADQIKEFPSRNPQPATRVYISTGIHGDEPAGPMAALQLLQENAWPVHLELYFCPCLNPPGFELKRRENRQGLDLNRQYLDPKAEETLAHIAWLERQPAFDFCLCLHEDWESHGFYLYELNLDHLPSLAERILQRVAEVCPLDPSEIIEGRPAKGGLIHPSTDPRSRPDWPEAFYLLTHKTRLSYTLEAPSDYPLSVRVAALAEGVKAGLERIAAGG